MEDGPGAAVLALAAGAVLSGCLDPGIDCWTRERYQAAARIPDGPIHEVLAGAYRGEVVTENPDNWWTDARFTGEACRMEVEHRPGGTWVRAQFLDEAVRLRARMGPGDSPFFTGETADGRAVVLQHHLGRPVALTLTRYREDGTLSYGACRPRGEPYRECHVAPEP